MPTPLMPGAPPSENVNESAGGPEISAEDGPSLVDEQSPRKRAKTSHAVNAERKGVARIRPEFLLGAAVSSIETQPPEAAADDEIEASGYAQKESAPATSRKARAKGQNTHRSFGYSRDAIALCASRARSPEFSPRECKFGANCRFEHDLRRYLKDGKSADLTTFDGRCPVWASRGACRAGWKCRFVGSHMQERATDDGRQELVLTEDDARKASGPEKEAGAAAAADEEDGEIVNGVSTEQKMSLSRRKLPTPKTDACLPWLDAAASGSKKAGGREEADAEADAGPPKDLASLDAAGTEREDHRARYHEPAFLPSEKRRLYFGPETPILAPLTTQGNLPFRRLCVGLGAQVTYSEMAMSLPLIQGQRSEWALLRAHASEASPPRVHATSPVRPGYDHAADIKFGAQISASKPWLAVKATEILTTFCPHLRAIDLNAGCPIDLVYRTGAGSALLDNPAKLERILRGMNAVSGPVPITVKIRMGTKDGKPTALKLARRLLLGGGEDVTTGSSAAPVAACGVAAITLHARSRQQRYTKSADWGYISECAALIQRLQAEQDAVADTIREPDARHQAAAGTVYFIGNGDCYSHLDYYDHLGSATGVASVMLGRGALIKPWIFEEIEQRQYLDKSGSERLAYIERFVRHGLEAWGADEVGLGTTRRFLLESLSFLSRYVPLGILEHLPPCIQDRPPRWRGRDDRETLLGSGNVKDWIKISEMFLGPTPPGFRFDPKHKSNAYDNELLAEG
ncbi:MAG: tRNA-dihydrouridine synthase 3 [Phylliscum demangeonii]|nr:MAG: tRNA-dihydrouridine synthase 3 [Phylliscum demangeonii]